MITILIRRLYLACPYITFGKLAGIGKKYLENHTIFSRKHLEMKTRIFIPLTVFYLIFSYTAVFAQKTVSDQDSPKELQNDTAAEQQQADEKERKNDMLDKSPALIPEKLTLIEAYMCEAVENFEPVNPAVVFSISLESICCFSAFDPVPEKAIIFHKWYRKDRLSTTQALSIEPPRWKTYSSIQLREADKGPWRVEIIGPKGQVMKVLRFSITD